MRKARRRLALAALALALAAGAAWALEVPYLAGRVNDGAGMLPADAVARIEQQLGALEAATGAQVAVLTVASLEGEDLEGFALRVAETWKLGRQGFDDGALLLIARDDRQMRLEVGYGLEPELTDLAARRILDDVLRPRFRAGDFAGGIEAGVEAIAAVVQGRPLQVEAPPAASGAPDDLRDAPLPMRVGIFVFFLGVVGMFSLSAVFTDGCGGWFLYAFLFPFWSAFPLMIWGAPAGAVFPVLWAVGFPVAWLLLRRTARGRAWRQTNPWAKALASTGRGGGWSSGSGGRSWSGGGFSGGGGRFGGGGASSRW